MKDSLSNFHQLLTIFPSTLHSDILLPITLPWLCSIQSTRMPVTSSY